MNPSESIVPSFLQPGDAICLAAPARFVTQEQVDDAVNWIEKAGYSPIIPEGILERSGQFGGDDAHRAKQLNDAFRDESARAIWAMRGGYGCGRVLPYLDATAFRANPKWIIGFSDITALHAWAHKQGVASLHAPVANTMGLVDESDRARMWSILRGEVSLEGAPVIGGNLSVLYSLLGTDYFPDANGAWILLEDLDEYLYHIDRMLLAFRLAGVFEGAKGILMGSFTDLHDNTIADGQSVDNPFGLNIKEIVEYHCPRELPIVWDVPVGHGPKNEAIALGLGSERIVEWKGGI